jgi:hypothetical protein
MSDFLTRLAERQLGQSPSVRPNVPATFAPVSHEQAPPEFEVSRAELDAFGARSEPSRADVASPSPGPRLERPLRKHPWPVAAEQAPEPRAVIPSSREVRRATPPRLSTLDESAESEPMVAPGERVSQRPAAVPRPRDVAAPASAPHQTFPTPSSPRSVSAPPTEPVRERVVPERSAVRPLPEAAPPDARRLALATVPRLVEASSARARAEPVVAPSRLGVSAPLPLRVATREKTRVEGAGSERIIHVNIGRVRVTAAAPAPRPPRPASTPKPRLTLADYLSQRQRGER